MAWFPPSATTAFCEINFRPLPDFSGMGSGSCAVGFETLKQGQMIAASGLGEKEAERNYRLKGLEGRAKNKIPTIPDPKLLLLSLQKDGFSCCFTERNLLSVWHTRTERWWKALIFPSKIRAVPVVLPSSWVSGSLNVEKSRWHSLFLFHFSYASTHFNKKKNYNPSMPKDNMMKAIGYSYLCSPHSGPKIRRICFLLCCCPSAPAFSSSTMLYFWYHPDMTLGNRGGKEHVGAVNWDTPRWLERMWDGGISSEEHADDAVLEMGAVPQKPSAESTVSPTDQEPDVIPAAETSGLLQNSKPSSWWASAQLWGVSTASTELWSFTCCWHPNALLCEGELMPGITKILLSLWVQIPVFSLTDPVLGAGSPFGVLWGLPFQSYPRSP